MLLCILLTVGPSAVSFPTEPATVPSAASPASLASPASALASPVAPPASDLFLASSFWRVLTLASLGAALVSELAELLADAATWRFDVLNWLELPSLMLAAAGTALSLEYRHPEQSTLDLERALVGLSLPP